MLISKLSRGMIKFMDCVDNKLLIVSSISTEIINVDELPVNPETRMRVLGAIHNQHCGCYIVRGGAKFRHVYSSVLETFYTGEYSALNVADKIVIDIGAFVGDTAVYFALKGAKRVVAVEPHPDAYTEMLENIRLNGLEGVIVPVNAGLASRPGKLCIAGNIETAITTYFKTGDCKDSVPAVTLSELLDEFDLRGSNMALKMDCEGCERDVILNDYKHVSLFDELIFEYHSPPDELITALSRDYKYTVAGSPSLGIVYCVKHVRR